MRIRVEPETIEEAAELVANLGPIGEALKSEPVSIIVVAAGIPIAVIEKAVIDTGNFCAAFTFKPAEAKPGEHPTKGKTR